jgi:hypothetical protein
MALKLGTSTPSKLYVGSTEVTKAYLGASEVYSSGPALDPDAQAYITAVETADGQALEAGVVTAINDFVVGCKADGIWTAIKASCILAGARTLSGALVPLVGTAPTNFNFVSGDYNRKTGLVGDGSTKYLDSNRNNNADPQNSKHLSIYRTSNHSGDKRYAGSGNIGSSGYSLLGHDTQFNLNYTGANRVSSYTAVSGAFTQGLFAVSRNLSNEQVVRLNGVNTTQSIASATPVNSTLTIFASAGPVFLSESRLAFYSIGEAIDLALLDTRVSALITAIDGAIP